MKGILFILALSTSLWAAAPADLGQLTLQDLCRAPRTPVSVRDNWSVRGSASNGFCAEVVCAEEGKKVTGVRCMLAGPAENTITIWRSFYPGEGTNSKPFEFNQVDVALTKDVACHEECKPKKPFLGGEVRRLERPECLRCMVTSHADDVERFILHPQTGAKLYNKTKCFELCRPPRGAFEQVGLVSDPAGCNSCATETFEYLLTREGNCVELAAGPEDRFVDRRACDGKQLLETEYYFEVQSVGVIGWLTGQQVDPTKGTCFERDVATMGYRYQRTTLPENCPSLVAAPVNDTGRESRKEETIEIFPSPRSRGGGPGAAQR